MLAFFDKYGVLLWDGTLDTLYMCALAIIFAYVLGLPMGIALYVTKPRGILENKIFYAVFSWLINILRSMPFIILMVLVSPATRLIVGQVIGSTAAIVPLVIGAAPFVARMVEHSLDEIDSGVIEACQCMGATPSQIIRKVLISESLPAIIRGLSISSITIVGYSAICGAFGGGGLGDIAIRYGHHRQQMDVMYATLILLIILVSVIQYVFSAIAKKVDKRS